MKLEWEEIIKSVGIIPPHEETAKKPPATTPFVNKSWNGSDVYVYMHFDSMPYFDVRNTDKYTIRIKNKLFCEWILARTRNYIVVTLFYWS